MSFTRTAKEWAAIFAEMPADEMVAVPFVVTKSDAEGSVYYLNGNEGVELDDQEWALVVHDYERNERFNEDSIYTLNWVVEKVVSDRYAEQEMKKEGK